MQAQKRSGFTLVELLVVIAIIAIIAAILFPVFASVREKGRQTTMLSNYEKIQRALGEFQLDQHHYPEVLYAYAAPGTSMTAPYGPNNHAAPKGLFPQFIKDPSIFIDPNNPDVNDPTDITASVDRPVPVNGPVSADATAGKQFYKADSMDISPKLNDANSLKPSEYVVRYQQSWQSITIAGQDTRRQLVFPNPPGDTFVTCTTYHVPKGVVLALFLNGSAKTIDSNKYLQEAGNSDANFWKIAPNK